MNRQRGYTLVELIITAAIISIMAMLAAPFFLSYLRSAEVQASAREVSVILASARSEALKQNCSIIATRATGGFTFSRPTPAANTTVCTNPTTGPFTVPGMSAGGIFKTSNAVALSGAASVQFGRLGSVELPTGGATFTLQSAKYGTTLRVNVAPSGRTVICPATGTCP